MKLYRVVRESYYDAGNRDQIHGVEVLYCGYDREEALRVYHQHAPECRGAAGAGNYGKRVRFGSKEVSVGV